MASGRRRVALHRARLTTRTVADGAVDLHCGGIVARRDHPLQSAHLTPDDLVRHPWLDCYAPAPASAPGPSPVRVLGDRDVAALA